MQHLVVTQGRAIITPRLLVVVLVLGALLPTIVGCSKTGSKGEPRERTPTAEQVAAMKAIESFAAEFGAGTSWLEFSRQKGWSEPVFSIEARSALMSSDGRPTVIIGHVIDVAELDRKGYEIRIGTGNLDLFLQADEKVVQTIMQNPHGMFEFFAAIVRVTSVRRRLFSLNAEASDDDEVSTPYATIEPSEGFVASGVCLTIQPLGDKGTTVAIWYHAF